MSANMNRIEDVLSYSFKATDRLFLDTSVWLPVYGPQADKDNNQTRFYSFAHKKIREKGCGIYLDVTVLSEFINWCARWEYNQLPDDRRPDSFKAYRNTQEFEDVAKEITINVRKILNVSKRIESGFQDIDINSVMTDFEKGKTDFNDHIIAELCKKGDYKLVTDDGDFAEIGLTIITANRRLLRTN